MSGRVVTGMFRTSTPTAAAQVQTSQGQFLVSQSRTCDYRDYRFTIVGSLSNQRGVDQERGCTFFLSESRLHQNWVDVDTGKVQVTVGQPPPSPHHNCSVEKAQCISYNINPVQTCNRSAEHQRIHHTHQSEQTR